MLTSTCESSVSFLINKRAERDAEITQIHEFTGVPTLIIYRSDFIYRPNIHLYFVGPKYLFLSLCDNKYQDSQGYMMK